MNEKDWLLIKTLYEENNISYAAKRLFISQPALSGRIKKIENEFGCKITVRHPRGISFTNEGELVYKYAVRQLAEYEYLKTTLSSHNHSTRGLVKIGVSNIFSKYKLPTLLAQFRNLYPEVEISMKSGYSHDRFKDFLEGHIHVCIARGEHNWNEQKTLLWEEPLALFSKYAVSLSTLPSLPYIHYVTDPLLQNVWDEWWYDHFITPPNTTLEVDSIDTALKLVQKNLGFTLLSQSCIVDEPNLYTLPLSYKDGAPLTRQTFMYYRNNYEQFAATKAFVDFINLSSNSI